MKDRLHNEEECCYYYTFNFVFHFIFNFLIVVIIIVTILVFFIKGRRNETLPSRQHQ